MTETTDAARTPQQEIHTIDEQEHEVDLIQLVTFRISEEEFGVDILSVQEIIRPIQITMVPHA
ncbi:MAG: chemotaxis protein CheW, partial [Desulfovibrio sp.]|nr:chemotaxis protein CheW [Desulfovibrio sp.]